MAITFSGRGVFREGLIRLEADQVVRNLDIVRRVQMPFVMSYALNRLGPILQAAHRDEMQRVFRAPVPFTLNSIFYTKSDKSKLYSFIGVKEFGGKGNPASKYLFPTVTDASRKQVYPTRFSKALAHRGFTASGSYMLGITSSDAARLGGNGRITPGQYTQVLFAIGAYDNDTFTGRRYANAKRPPKKDYFFARPGNKQGISPGIYKRKASGKGIDMLFKYFPAPPSVQTRYDFYGLTDRVVQQQFPVLVNQKLAELFGR